MCDYENTVGVEVDAVVINRQDIDYSVIAKSLTNNQIITAFSLLSTKTGYIFKGVKKTNAVLMEPVANDFGSDRSKHTFNGVAPMNAANRKAYKEMMANPDGFVVVVRIKTIETADIESFVVLGLHQGMYASTTYNTAENGGGVAISLSSKDGYEEPNMGYSLQITDYDTTLGLFNDKFAA